MHEWITVRMTDDMISRLDTFIASQPGYLSRQELVRRCVELVLDHPEHLSRLAGDQARWFLPEVILCKATAPLVSSAKTGKASLLPSTPAIRRFHRISGPAFRV